MKELSTIAVVGASARAAGFSVLRSGRRAVTADLFADADLARCCSVTKISAYPNGLSKWLAQTECDAWLYTGALENCPELVEQMAEMRPLLGNSGEVLRRCRNPWALIENGLPVPETVAVSDALPLDGSWLCKTYRGSSGSGVWELRDGVSRQRGIETGAVFQRRVDGQLTSAVLVFGDGWYKTLGTTKQWVGKAVIGAARFQYAGSVTSNITNIAFFDLALDRIGLVLSERFGLRGLVGVDLIVEDEQVWLLEVNPRYTASVEIVERSQSVSAIDAHVAACMGARLEEIEWGVDCEKSFGKAVLYAKQDVEIGQSFFEWAMGDKNEIADVPCAGSEIPAGRPVLTVMASCRELADDRFLLQRIAEVEARLYGK